MKPKIQKLASKILVGLALLGGMGALPATVKAQSSPTNSVPASPQNFFQTAANYFTSANTNYTWTGNTLEVAGGADYMSSVNWANYLDAQYDIGRFDISAKMRNAGIAGTVDSAEAGIGYTLISYYSVKLEAGIDGGYNLDRNTALIEPKLTLRDKLTPNTFLGLAISLPIWTNGRPLNTVPDIGIETGFTY
jgi:hypothetical protein